MGSQLQQHQRRQQPRRVHFIFIMGMLVGVAISFVFQTSQLMKSFSEITILMGQPPATPPVSSNNTNNSITANPSDQQKEVLSEKHRRLPPSRWYKGADRQYHGHHEIFIVSILAGLLREGFLGDGAILDAGAQFGEQAAHMAYLQPNRTVYALDPAPSNIAEITKRYGRLPNLNIVRAGLGSEQTNVSLEGETTKWGVSNMGDATHFEVLTLDSLFFDTADSDGAPPPPPLALAHLDVEGKELDVLKGALNVIATQKPILTTEITVHVNANYTVDLLSFLDSHGYDSYMIHEVAGNRMDIRNLLNIPRSRSIDLIFSDTFNLAQAAHVITRVDKENIFELVHPCCAPHAGCCPTPTDATDRYGCCMEATVAKYRAAHNITEHMVTPDAMIDFNLAYQDGLKRWYRLKQRFKKKD